jgi:hypothetical protein
MIDVPMINFLVIYFPRDNILLILINLCVTYMSADFTCKGINSLGNVMLTFLEVKSVNFLIANVNIHFVAVSSSLIS